MVSWRGWLVLGVAALAATASSTVEASSIRVRITTHDSAKQQNHQSVLGSAKGDTKDCEINGVHLRHHSLHHYAEKAYVACSRGVAACYLMNRHHDHATQVSCPTKNLAKLISEHQLKEEEDRRRLSLAVVDSNRKWSSGVVCYDLNSEYPFDTTQKSLIFDAMKVYEKETNVRFLPLTKCRSNKMTSYCNGCVDYVNFKHPPTGRDCNSSIGVNGAGPQIMFLADRCFEGDGSLKNDYGTAMHEIGHALGLYHEHQHPQRKVALFWDDISTSLWGEMKIRDVSVGGAYDPDSIMHYPDSYGFCYPRYCTASVTTNCVPQGTKFCNLNDDPTKCVEPNKALCDDTKTKAIGQRRFLSQGDLDALNELYKTAQWSAAASFVG